jgi:peptidyl-prolyl cis-trans isomerase C
MSAAARADGAAALRRASRPAQSLGIAGPVVAKFAAAAARAASVAAALALFGCVARESEIAAKPVLRVNHREIAAREFADRLALRLKNFDALYVKDEANLRRAKEQTVQAFVLEAAARDYAREAKLSVDAKEIEAEASAVRAKYPDDLAFRRSLAQENLSYEAWRESLEFLLLQRKIAAKINESLPSPSEEEMKAYYNEKKNLWRRPARVRLRQVVLAKEDDAHRIYEQLVSGASNMTRVAKEFSIALEAQNGGETGWIEKGTLEVFDLAFKLSVGGRSKVLKSPYGYHIFEVLAKEPEAHLSFADAKAKIRAQIMERREQAAFSSWLEQQVRKATVYRNDGLIDAIKVSTRGN